MEERVAMAVMMTEAMARVGKLQARLQGMLRWAGRRARQGEGAAPSRDTSISLMCSLFHTPTSCINFIIGL